MSNKKLPRPKQTVSKRAKHTGSIERTTMKAHYHYSTTILAGGSTSVLKQIILAPSISDFD